MWVIYPGPIGILKSLFMKLYKSPIQHKPKNKHPKKQRRKIEINRYINNCRNSARKHARIFVRGHYLFREANSFPRAKLEENCELRGTDNVQGQISEHIFAPNGDYCLYYPSNLFRNARNLKIGEYLTIRPVARKVNSP